MHKGDKLLVAFATPYELGDDKSVLLDTGVIQWRAHACYKDDYDGRRLYSVMIHGKNMRDTSQIMYLPAEGWLSVESQGESVRFPCTTTECANQIVSLYTAGLDRVLMPAHRGANWGGIPLEL
jgi:hypothetical protein